MFAWAKAGVSMSHFAASQYTEFPHVPISQLAPGDLVFFGSPIHHVGIYIGGGRMIDAPHTGDYVRIQDAFRSDYVGAGRP
jgi:cell wall-associated NlpC family hydrolase